MARYNFVLLLAALFAVTYVTAHSSESRESTRSVESWESTKSVESAESTEPSSEVRCRGQNEVWTRCASRCERRCPIAGRPQICGRPTSSRCVAKCVCERGHVRGPGGRCVRREDCPVQQRCGRNQVWNDCGGCEETCPSVEGTCAAACVPRCSCVRGYVIGPEGICIRKDQCPKPVCGENQVWRECGNDCERRCDDDPKNPRMCPAVCRPKCSCKQGLVWNREGKCVEEKECKRRW